MADTNNSEHPADTPSSPPEMHNSLHLCGGTRFSASASPASASPASASPVSASPASASPVSASPASASPNAHEDEKELWLAEYRHGHEGGGGDRPYSLLEPIYARDEAEARRIVHWQLRRMSRPLTLFRLRRAPEGFRVRHAYLPGKLPSLAGCTPEGQDERPTVTTWIEDDFIYVFMAWFRRHGCHVERLPSGHYRVLFPPGTTFEEDRTFIAEEQHITITLPDGASAEEIRLLRDDPTYNLLLIEADR